MVTFGTYLYNIHYTYYDNITIFDTLVVQVVMSKYLRHINLYKVIRFSCYSCIYTLTCMYLW